MKQCNFGQQIKNKSSLAKIISWFIKIESILCCSSLNTGYFGQPKGNNSGRNDPILPNVSLC